MQRNVHPLYGKVTGIPLVAVPPAVLFASAFHMFANAETKFLANDVWKGKSAVEIISITQNIFQMTHWAGFIYILLMIYAVSLMKYLWHLVMRKITDKVRKDGKIAGPAPVQFFIFHTSGVASWLGIIMIAFSIKNGFFPGHPFTAIDEFFRQNFLWKCALGAVLLVFWVKYYESNTQIFMEIYKNKSLVSTVRIASLIIPIVLFVSVVVAGIFSVYLLQRAVQ